MDPEEIEFLAENETVEILPLFEQRKIHLISGEIGPFRLNIPLRVPIWFAANLKTRQQCRIVFPSWMNVEQLQELKNQEINNSSFCKMPSEYYIIEAQMLMRIAEDDIDCGDAIRTLIKDIWDTRLAKLRTSVDQFIKHGGEHARLDNLTSMEINSVRPLLPHALDLLNRLRSHTSLPYTQSHSHTSSNSFRS